MTRLLPILFLLLAAPACAERPVGDLSRHVAQCWEEKRDAVLTAGHFDLGEPVVSGFTSGCGVLSGAGAADAGLWRKPNDLFGAATIVRSYCPGASLHFRGDRFELADLTLTGLRSVNADGRVVPAAGTVGVLVSKGGESGLGTGKGLLSGVVFDMLDTALQFGVAAEEHNNDECVLERCQASSCNTFTRLVNSQAMGVAVRDYIGHSSVGTHFALRGGGKLWVESPTLHGGVVVRLEGGNPPKYRTGPNNQRIDLVGLSVDSNHKGRLVLVEVDQDDPETPEDESGDCWAHIHIRGGHISGKTASLGTVGEKVRVTVDGLTAASPVKVRERIEDINGRPAHAEYFLPVYPPKGDTGGRVRFVVPGRPDLGSGPWEVVE